MAEVASAHHGYLQTLGHGPRDDFLSRLLPWLSGLCGSASALLRLCYDAFDGGSLLAATALAVVALRAQFLVGFVLYYFLVFFNVVLASSRLA